MFYSVELGVSIITVVCGLAALRYFSKNPIASNGQQGFFLNEKSKTLPNGSLVRFSESGLSEVDNVDLAESEHTAFCRRKCENADGSTQSFMEVVAYGKKSAVCIGFTILKSRVVLYFNHRSVGEQSEKMKMYLIGTDNIFTEVSDRDEFFGYINASNFKASYEFRGIDNFEEVRELALDMFGDLKN